MSAGEGSDEKMLVEERIYSSYPEVEELLANDLERQQLRVLLRCPRRHPIETVVLDADYNGHLYLTSLVSYENNFDPREGDRQTVNALSATKWPAEDSMSAARITLPCPRCKYRGTKTQAELLKLFVLARFVLDTPDIQLQD